MAHIHEVIDSDKRFIIDAETREISTENGAKVIIQYDHNSERVTFQAPRMIDGHDMSLCTKVEVHFLNISTDGTKQNADVYIADDLTAEEDAVYFTWLISQNATQLEGTLNFVVRFSCLTGSTYDYIWHSAIYEGLPITAGYYNSEAVAERYSDVLQAWAEKIDAHLIESIEQTTESNESGGKNVLTVRLFDGSVSTFVVRNGIDGKDGTDGLNYAVEVVESKPTEADMANDTLYLYPDGEADFPEEIAKIKSGATVVGKAAEATHATSADSATSAGEAAHATNADDAMHAAVADDAAKVGGNAVAVASDGKVTIGEAVVFRKIPVSLDIVSEDDNEESNTLIINARALESGCCYEFTCANGSIRHRFTAYYHENGSFDFVSCQDIWVSFAETQITHQYFDKSIINGMDNKPEKILLHWKQERYSVPDFTRTDRDFAFSVVEIFKLSEV